MKNAKLLKSAVLSTALLFVGGAQAQTNGATSLVVAVVSSLTVNAAQMDFGTHPSTSFTSATNVVLTCDASGNPQYTPTPSVTGGCGNVVIETSSATDVSYRISVIGSVLSATGLTSLTTSAWTIYDAGVAVAASTTHTISSAAEDNYRVGGTIAVPANAAVGTYRGTYTVTASVQ